MGIFSRTKSFLSGFINFKFDKWLDLESIKENSDYLINQTKYLFRLPKPSHPETFKEALLRFEISDVELAEKLRYHKNLVYLFLSIAGLFFLYFLYLFCFRKNFMGACMTFSLLLYSLSQAFRYHFWLFQLRQEKLGCTIREWLASFKKKKVVHG